MDFIKIAAHCCDEAVVGASVAEGLVGNIQEWRPQTSAVTRRDQITASEFVNAVFLALPVTTVPLAHEKA